MNTISTILASAAATGLIALAPAAFAQTRVAPVTVEALPSVFVSFADLDLDGDAGMKVLGARLRGAADKVCGQRSRLMKVDAQRKACRESALAGAWGQVAEIKSNRALARSDRLIRVAANTGGSR